MALEAKLWCMLFVLLATLNSKNLANGTPTVPCYFIFGDSLADSGSNNLLLTIAKAITPPYGIDFPTGTTGRFCNGRTASDIIGELAGMTTFIPPFPMATTADIMKGVNYASAAAGILDESGKDLGENIPFTMQIARHGLVVSQIKSRLGNNESASSYLNKCLYMVTIGNNDYIHNYYMDFYPSSQLYNPEQYAEHLVQHISPQIKSLYDLGARKIGLPGVGPIGCTPNALATYPRNGTKCVDNMNVAAELYNQALKSFVDKFNKENVNAQITFLNISGIFFDDASAQGFKVIDAPCCESLGNLTCMPFGTPCQNRSEYRYWDDYHTTEAANRYVAQRLFHAANPTDAHPFDTWHHYGERNVSLAGVGPINWLHPKCNIILWDKMNNAVQLFNNRLITIVDKIHAKHKDDAKFIPMNTLIKTPPGLVPEVVNITEANQAL